ncbi:MAG: ROK family protein [bacterium]
MKDQKKARRKTQILYYIWKEGPISRGALSEILKLNLPTISNCVNELLAQKEIIEEGFATSTGGRKAQLLDVNPAFGAVIAVDFSSRGLTSAAADLKGNILNQTTSPFKPTIGKEKALEMIFEAVQSQVSFLKQRQQGPLRQVGLGFSGLVDERSGISIVFPRFENWRDVPIRKLVEEKFKIPSVLDNHISAIALAENLFGNYKTFNNVLYIHLGPGIGLGIILNGRVYKGSKLNVGELGHTTVSENGPLCYCGNYGCLESVASDYALVAQAEQALKDGVKSRVLEFSENGRLHSTAPIFQAAGAGDRLATNLIEKVGSHLGAAIANLINLLGPEVILIGGTMAENGDMLIELICRTLRSRALERMESGVEIKISSFGKQEGIMGAVALALHNYYTVNLKGTI